MTDLNLIRTFVAVCEEGSVTAAAARLSQPKSTVSRHLARLEEVMARPLLERDRSGVALTPEGKRLFEQVQASIHVLEPLAKPLRRAPAGGRVRVQAPRYFARGPMAQVVLDFMRAEPEVTVELHGEARLAETDAAGMDVVVHVGSRDVAGAEARPLGQVAARLYAAPALFGSQPLPATPAALSGYPFLSMCGTAGLPERIVLSGNTGQSTGISCKTRFATNEIDLLLRAARDGAGFVALPEFVGAAEVAAGRFVPLLPHLWTDRFMVVLTVLSRTRNPAARRFAEFAVPRLANLQTIEA